MDDDFQVSHHRARSSCTQKLVRPGLAVRTAIPRLLALALLASALLTTLLALGGCDHKPAKLPSSPEPPRPKVSARGDRQSLFGNAILSNALLSYQVQCNEQRASIRICRIPTQVRAKREARHT